LGFVLQPTWLPKLNLSLDWYNIDVHDAIATLSAQNIVNYCFFGDAKLCPLITRDSTGAITSISATYINLADVKTSGLDLEATYDLNLGAAGDLKSHLLATYIDTFSYFDGRTRSSFVDVTGNTNNTGFPVDAPRWRGSFSETYDIGRFTLDARARYVNGGYLSTVTSIDRNVTASQTYVDLGLQYAIRSDRSWVLYGNVVNVFDKAAPPDPNPALFDLIGRSYNVGLRMALQ
jgi:outer membrane receptor protein involved in Fe transport